MARLIDMLSGDRKPDPPRPQDEPSGVRLTVEPSKRLLAAIDLFAKDGRTREEALLMLAAGGAASVNLIGGLIQRVTRGLGEGGRPPGLIVSDLPEKKKE